MNHRQPTAAPLGAGAGQGLAAPGARLPRRRSLLGLVLAATGPPLLTLVLANLRGHVDLPGVLLLYLLLVVAVATVGGFVPAAICAVGGFALANWYFTPPLYRWSIAERKNLLALLVFLVVAGVVSGLVDQAARRAAEARRARAEAEALARLGGTLLHGHDPLPELVEQLRMVFALDGVAVLRRRPAPIPGAAGAASPLATARVGSARAEAGAGAEAEPGGAGAGGWQVQAAAGQAPIRPGQATHTLTLADTTILALRGRRLTSDDRRVLDAFADQLAVALEARRLAQQAATASELAQANDLRTALLAAVSHDLRTPLALIKTSVTSLLDPDVRWPPTEAAQFLATINDATDRLDTLVGNLLDMSRLHTGALGMLTRPVGLEEVVPAALTDLADQARRVEVEVDVPETLPRVSADPGLLERAIANLVTNAIAHSPDERPVRLVARQHDSRIELAVIDYGPGIPPADRQRLFQPFQRLGDARTRPGGLGLGLAVAHGFVQAMGGRIALDDTPGGGLTMRISLKVAGSP